MDEMKLGPTPDPATNEYIAAVYAHYLETTPELIDDLERTLFDGDPVPLLRILKIIAAASNVVSAVRVARTAKQLVVILDRLPYISRTYLGLEFARLRVEFEAARSEIEFILQTLAST